MKTKNVLLISLVIFSLMNFTGCGRIEKILNHSGSEDQETGKAFKESYEKETDPGIITMMYGDALGYKRCFCTCEYDFGGACWTLYNSEEEPIALQFGYNYEAPDWYSFDMDNDGTDELICPCVYGGDGAERVFVYRNNNGVIEIGSYETDMGVPEYRVYYAGDGKIMLLNWEQDKEYVLGIDDFEFEVFDLENFPW